MATTIAEVRPRERVITAALHHVPKDARIVEVGCMFKEDEGLSTLHLARHSDRFISIEYDAAHVEAAREILRRRAPDLPPVNFRIGHSIAVMPSVLAELGALDFALLDGAGHPEVCLHEFEMVCRHLSPNGIIIVDDAQEIATSPAYAIPRPFGKASLILPILTIGQYLAGREAHRTANVAPDGPDAPPYASSLAHMAFDWLPPGRSFTVHGTGHRMLIFGPSETVEAITSAAAPRPRSPAPSRARQLALRILSAVS